jgi:hypothetical protein
MRGYNIIFTRIKLKLPELRGILIESKIFVFSKIPGSNIIGVFLKGGILISAIQYYLKL